MTPDVIVCWPPDCDYPVWRRFLRDNRERFGRVFVMFTWATRRGPNITDFLGDMFGPLRAETYNARMPRSNSEDWRDLAINHALDCSESEWVWFTEQDFLIRDPIRFWESIEAGSRHHAIGFRDTNDRWHPACLFVRRSEIDRTSRYFGPEPVDHFYTFSQEIHDVYDIEADLSRGVEFDHMQGVSEAQQLLLTGKPLGFRPDRMRAYLRECLDAGVELEPSWKARAEQEVMANV